MVRRSMTGVNETYFGFELGERARRLVAIAKWLWLQMRASWLEVMDIQIRSGRDIWRPPF
jgi:hypothetical protein